MHHDTFAMIRATIFVLLILAFIGCCTIEASPATYLP